MERWPVTRPMSAVGHERTSAPQSGHRLGSFPPPALGEHHHHQQRLNLTQAGSQGVRHLADFTFDHAGFILESNSPSASFMCLSLSLGLMGMYLLSGTSRTRP